MTTKKQIEDVVIVTPEYYGDTMVGGLAVSVHGLAQSLLKKGVQPSIIMPAYQKPRSDDKEEKFTSAPFYEDEEAAKPEVHSYRKDGIDIHKVTNFATYPFTYNSEDGVIDITNETYKRMTRRTFKAFQIFGAQIPKVINQLELEKTDAIHLMEWSTASSAYWLRQNKSFDQVPIVLTSHNLNYAGEVPFNVNMDERRLVKDSPTFNMLAACLRDSQGRTYSSLLELGVQYADAVNTVSPSEASEVLAGRDGINVNLLEPLRQKGLVGILNGIDPTIMNPETDGYIDRFPTNNYETIQRGKKDNKHALVHDLGTLPSRFHKSDFSINPDEPLITMMCRLTEQKSAAEVIDVANRINNEVEGVQLLIVGEPENEAIRTKAYDAAFDNERVFSYPYFVKPNLQHRILAASDAILQPSKWEPCGYTQLEGMRYAAIPIVTMVGGHKDTVIPFRDKVGYGIQIREPSPEGILKGIKDFRDLFVNKESRKNAVMNAVGVDFTWDSPERSASVDKYIELYSEAGSNRQDSD